jgi:MtN3 and saliva related transmembrane protein
MWEYVGMAAATLTMFSFVPQVIQIYKTKSARDVSLLTLVQLALGVALWIIYGVHLGNRVIIIANAVTLVTLLTALGLYFTYRRERPFL